MSGNCNWCGKELESVVYNEENSKFEFIVRCSSCKMRYAKKDDDNRATT